MGTNKHEEILRCHHSALSENFFIRRKALDLRGSKGLKEEQG